MFLKTLFGTQLILKKIFLTGLGAVVLGTSVHYGVAKPLNRHNSTHHLPGSQPLLESHRGNPYDKVSSEAYLVKDFKRIENLPSISPSLTASYLEPKTKSRHINEFATEIKNYVAKKLEPITNKEEYTVLLKARKLASHDKKMAAVSDIEIPYKSYFFNKQVRELEKAHLIQDLLWSLIEESSNEKTVVRPSSVKIDLSIDKVDSNLEKEIDQQQFPLLANTINNLSIKFTIFNPNREVKHIFKAIPVLPFQEANFTLFLTQGEIRPFISPFHTSSLLNKSTKWGIIPNKNRKFEISIESKSGHYEVKKFELTRLSLLWGKSKFIDDEAINHTSVNAPTYKDYSEIATEMLSGITEEQVKKDLETWYGSLAAFHLKLRIKDIQKLMKIMEMKIFKSPEGRDLSGLEMFINSSTWRLSLYNWIKLKQNASKIVDSFFVDEGVQKDHHLKMSDLEYWVKSLHWALGQMADNIQIGVRWLQTPKLEQNSPTEDSPFRSLSFKLEQEIKWNKTVQLPFRGCWDDDQQSWSNSTKENCQGDSKHHFDLSSKLGQLHHILAPLEDILGAGIFKLIPDAEQFLGWDNWEIEQDEKLVNIYTAENSPIRPSLAEPFDAWERRKIVPGWKALDVRVTHDLSNFYKFFYKIYEKIDEYKDGNKVNVTSLSDAIKGIQTATEQAKQTPISFAVHMINQLWDKNYWSKKDTPEKDRPWPVFFKALLGRPFTIDSTQVFIGYSSNLFDIEDWVYQGMESSTVAETTTTPEQKIYKLNRDWQSKEVNKSRNIPDTEWDFPAKFKNKKMEKLISNFSVSYSSYFPNDPIVFDFEKHPNWNKFLEYEGSTTEGIVANKDKVKEIFKDMFTQKPAITSIASFPYENSVNWKKIKISFTQLEMEKALKTVLSLKTNINSLVASFINLNLHDILGEYIKRDAMLITINLMLEDGSSTIIRNPLTIFNKGIYSTYRFGVSPEFDKERLSNSAKSLIDMAGLS